jgi:hypothetical protein
MKRVNNGHRWTQEEMKALITLWGDDEPVEEIAKAFNVTVPGLNKVVCKLRRMGIPLQYRKRGNRAGRTGKLWSQSEVEYLIRRRAEAITAHQIAAEMNRTPYAISGMIERLRREAIPVTMLGQGVKRLYDVTALKAMFADPTSPVYASK